MPNIFNLIMNFLLTIVDKAKGQLNLWLYNRPPPWPSSLELESNPPQNATTDVSEMMWMQWPLLVIGVCYAAVSAILQALQTTGPLTMRSQMVYIAMVISFTSLMVSVYLHSIYKRTSVVAVHVGLLFGSIAVMVALVTNLHTPLMITSIAIYLLGIFIIVSANLFKPS